MGNTMQTFLVLHVLGERNFTEIFQERHNKIKVARFFSKGRVYCKER